jgi:hypothetical protein
MAKAHLTDAKRERFIATAYAIDFDVLRAAEVTITRGTTDPVPTFAKPETLSVGELLNAYPLYAPKTFDVFGLRAAFKTDTETVEIDEKSAAGRVAWILYRIWKQDQSTSEILWCWYDSDYVYDEPMASEVFFLAYAGDIIYERISLVTTQDRPTSEFLRLFKRVDVEQPIWLNDHRLEQARIAQYYREFYTTTDTGKLMILRSDQPNLYYFQEGRSSSQLLLAELLSVSLSVRRSVKVVAWLLAALLLVLVFR